MRQDKLVVGLGRLELPTSRLSGVRSNHLSYRPLKLISVRCPEEKEKRRERYSGQKLNVRSRKSEVKRFRFLLLTMFLSTEIKVITEPFLTSEIILLISDP